MHVVRGVAAAVATMDNRLGRDATQVLSTEHDETVHLMATNDSLRPQQWALKLGRDEIDSRATRPGGGAGLVVDDMQCASLRAAGGVTGRDCSGRVIGDRCPGDTADDECGDDGRYARREEP